MNNKDHINTGVYPVAEQPHTPQAYLASQYWLKMNKLYKEVKKATSSLSREDWYNVSHAVPGLRTDKESALQQVYDRLDKRESNQSNIELIDDALDLVSNGKLVVGLARALNVKLESK